MYTCLKRSAAFTNELLLTYKSIAEHYKKHIFTYSYVTVFAKTCHIRTQRFSSPIDSSINKQTLIVTTPLPQVDWSAFSEACF